VARPCGTDGAVESEREERPLAVHQIVDVQHEIRGSPCDALTMRHVIEGMPQFRTLGDERLHIIEALAGGLERLLEFPFGLGLRFAERHLHAAVRVDLPFARRFDGQENHVLEVIHHGGLDAIRLRGRHAAEGLEAEDHVRLLVHRVVDVLGDLEMPLAAAREPVVVRLRQRGQLPHVEKWMRNTTQTRDVAVVEV
jgi:hypothetical protein